MPISALNVSYARSIRYTKRQKECTPRPRSKVLPFTCSGRPSGRRHGRARRAEGPARRGLPIKPEGDGFFGLGPPSARTGLSGDAELEIRPTNGARPPQPQPGGGPLPRNPVGRRRRKGAPGGARLPLEISEVRQAKGALNTTAKGSLLAAMLNM